jgi:hypothetical protein
MPRKNFELNKPSIRRAEMRRIFKRAPRTSKAPTGPDPQLMCECQPYCAGTKCGSSGSEIPRAPIVRADGSVVPQLSFEEGLAWLADY